MTRRRALANESPALRIGAVYSTRVSEEPGRSRAAVVGFVAGFAVAIGICWAFGGRLSPALAALLIFCCCAGGTVGGALTVRPRPLPDVDDEWDEFERAFWRYVSKQRSSSRH